jgi:lipoate-protein ligase A
MWRFLDAGPQDAATAIGRMPALAQQVATGAWEGILLTGVWGRAHFNVGWFEDIDAVLDLEAARREGVQVVRRPAIGGGTAFYDEGCAAMAAFFVPHRDDETLDDVLARYEAVLRRAFDALGLAGATFEHGDLRWRGRKLGAVISQHVMGARVAGCFLNLRRPDLELYLRVAHVPDEKFADKAVKDMVAYVATPADVRGTDVSYEEFRDAVVAAVGVPLEAKPPPEQEDEHVRSFADLVASRDWVTRRSSARFAASAPAGSRIGFANHKGRKLVRAGVALGADGVLEAVMMAGDMHLSPPEALDDLAASLVGLRPEDPSVRERVAAALAAAEQADEHLGITTDDIVAAIRKAVEGTEEAET